MDKIKALNLIGMAYRARKVVNGYESVMACVVSGKAKCVIIANDASGKTIEAFSKKCYFYHVPMCMDFNTDEISKAIGKGLAKVITITDNGFCKSLNKLLSEV